jgi:hypothetical protein
LLSNNIIQIKKGIGEVTKNVEGGQNQVVE